ncbi:sec-independent protein translocase protein TATB, chloroplastic-like isoform X2 [Tripterygium wilfordii]|nr:sec-independent protein translocase protein TATB, chloroplastic-like isoform X2 [Tripterygium wilfordii]
MVVQASLFGVGAPEALVIGVVALLVFGPRGLAEVARNLGKTLRAFQPTIRELQDVSREFKSSLEREIGLDDISGSAQNIYDSDKGNATFTPSGPNRKDSPTMSDPNGIPSPNRAYTSEEYLKITEEQLKASATQQHQPNPPGESQLEPKSQPQVTIQEAASAVPPPQKPESER